MISTILNKLSYKRKISNFYLHLITILSFLFIPDNIKYNNLLIDYIS